MNKWPFVIEIYWEITGWFTSLKYWPSVCVGSGIPDRKGEEADRTSNYYHCGIGGRIYPDQQYLPMFQMIMVFNANK